MKNKLLGILLVMVLAVTGFGLVGCGGKTEIDPNNPPSQEEVDEPTTPENPEEQELDDYITPAEETVTLEESVFEFDFLTADEFRCNVSIDYIGEGDVAVIVGVKDMQTNMVVPAYVISENNTYPVVWVKDDVFAFPELDNDGNYIKDQANNKVYNNNIELERVTIPSTVAYVSTYAFIGCVNIKHIYLNDRTTTIEMEGALNNLFDSKIAHKHNLTINEFWATSMNTINDLAEEYRAFFKTDVNEPCMWYLGNSNNPFLYLYNYTNFNYWSDQARGDRDDFTLTVHQGCKVIENFAFSRQFRLTNVNLPDGIITIGTDAFQATTISNINIPNSVTSIGSYAFSECVYLTIINIPSGISTIKEYTFHGCYMLTSVTIPENILSIEDNAFSECYGLFEIYNLTNLNITIGSTDDGGVALYAKVIHTTQNEASRITILGGVTYYIEDESSYIALNLKDKSLKEVLIDNRTTAINQFAFDGCGNITNITIPSGVIKIGRAAFELCSSLKSITIPSSVTYIGDYAFWGCNSVTNATFDSPTGWFVTRNESATSGTNVTLTDPSTNATYLTSTFADQYWKRSN